MGGVFWVSSKLFDARTPRPEAVNEAIGGDDLAAWLSQRLRAANLAADKPWPEDHGWDFGVEADGSKYLISCSCEIKDWGNETPEFAIAVSKMRGFMDRMRGRNGFADDDPVKRAIGAVLSAEKATEMMRWEPDAR